MIYPLFCKEYNLWIGKPGVRILAHHIHAHALGSVAEEEKPLRNTMDNHLKGVAALDACREAVTPDGSRRLIHGSLQDTCCGDLG